MSDTFFPHIEDELLGDICADYARLLEDVGDITQLLDLDKYDEMADSHARGEELAARQEQLGRKLKLDLSADFPEHMDSQVVEVFLESVLIAEHYPDSVGPVAEMATSIPLVTMPKFLATSCSPEQREALVSKICDHFQVGEPVLQKARARAEDARVRLAARRELVDQLRAMVLDAQGEVVAKPELKAVFDLFFPENPLTADDIDLVITRTCIYWCLPSQKELGDRPDAEAIYDWLKYTNRFAFQYFSHFPTFSSFDARDSAPELIERLANSLSCRPVEVVDRLNAATTIEKTPEIEKYLIHDSWGHIWQGDLTELARMYDTMESLKSPVDCNEHLTLPNGNVISPMDTVYLNRKGQLEFDEELAVDYIDQWLRIRVRTLLAPIVAELTADMVEYKFKLDNKEDADLLPSSSMFADQPSKLDFAWVDLGYFIRTLKRINLVYNKNKALRENLIDRMVILLKTKYPRQYKQVESPEALRESTSAIVERFCEIIEQRQDQHLDQKLAAQDVSQPNGFFLLFTNLLRLQFTVNHLIQEHLEPSEGDTCEAFNVLNIFIARYFTANPLTNFWNLDETIAACGLSMCEWVAGRELPNT